MYHAGTFEGYGICEYISQRMNFRARFLPPITLTIAAVLLMVIAWITGGWSLGYCLAPLTFTSLLSPGIGSTTKTRSERFAMLMGLIAGFAVALIMPVFHQQLKTTTMISCLGVIALYAAVLSALARLLAQRMPSTTAAGAVILLSATWLTWPIWATALISGRVSGWLISLHPLFVINSLTPQLGNWTEQRVAYQLTNLGQDATYQLPTSAWPFVFVYGAIAICLEVIQASRARSVAV